MKDGITVDRYRPQYGEGIAHCFRTVYGNGYPIKSVYDPDMLKAEFDKGNFYPVVAINHKYEVVGVMALYRSSAPYKDLYEAGAGIVLPEYRGLKIAEQLYQYLSEYLTREVNIEEMFGESVCNHIKIQRMVLHYECIETGLEIDLMPAEAYSQEKSSSGRVTVDLFFRSYRDRPQDVYIPHIYEDICKFLYEDPKRRRNLTPSTQDIPKNAFTLGDYVYFEFAQVGRLKISSIGSDFASYVDNYERELTIKGLFVSQVFLRLDCPWVGRATEILLSKGYFFGGLLPRWFDVDGIFMQKIYGEPNWEGIILFSDRAKRILGFIKDDWKRTQH